MSGLQRWGGIAALVDGATYLLGFAILLTVVAPSAYGTGSANPARVAAFFVENAGLVHFWHLVIYVVNAVFLVILVLALHHRLREDAPELAAVGAAFGLIWAALVLGSGMLANVALGELAELYPASPDAAVALWHTVNRVQDGLGGGNEIAGGTWVLLVSWAARQTGALPRGLAWLGLLIGVAGLLTTVPALATPSGAVFGIGFIMWFIWVGIVLLRRPGRAPPQRRGRA